jgi:hypothetical protein
VLELLAVVEALALVLEQGPGPPPTLRKSFLESDSSDLEVSERNSFLDSSADQAEGIIINSARRRFFISNSR